MWQVCKFVGLLFLPLLLAKILNGRHVCYAAPYAAPHPCPIDHPPSNLRSLTGVKYKDDPTIMAWWAHWGGQVLCAVLCCAVLR